MVTQTNRGEVHREMVTDRIVHPRARGKVTNQTVRHGSKEVVTNLIVHQGMDFNLIQNRMESIL